MNLSSHAQIRMQQRGISARVVKWLQDYGRHTPDHRKGTIVHFDRRSKQKLRQALPSKALAKYDKQLDAYLIMTDGLVVTVGHRYKRIRNP